MGRGDPVLKEAVVKKRLRHLVACSPKRDLKSNEE